MFKVTEEMAKYEMVSRIYCIPQYMWDSIERYINDHILPGSFLTAVLCNDFCEVVGNADKENIKNLPAYGYFLYWHLPSNCWGNKKKVENWINQKVKEI